jgi:hypothetical protein
MSNDERPSELTELPTDMDYAPGGNDVENETEMESADDAARPTKKAKVEKGKAVKSSVRDVVDNARKELVSGKGKGREGGGEKQGQRHKMNQDNAEYTTLPHGNDGNDSTYQLSDKVQSFVLSFLMLPESFLTLDENTLFYFNLSSRNKAPYAPEKIKGWAKGVQPPSRPASVASGTLHSTNLKQPSLTVGTSRSSKTSIKTKAQTHDDDDDVQIGAFSDMDELDGPERQFAINSPPKGKKRVTSSVMSCLAFFLFKILTKYL